MLLTEECASANSPTTVWLVIRCGHKCFPILPNRMCYKLMLQEVNRNVNTILLVMVVVVALWEHFGFLRWHLSSGGWKRSRQMTPLWPCKTSCYCSFKTMSVCYHCCPRSVLKCLCVYFECTAWPSLVFLNVCEHIRKWTHMVEMACSAFKICTENDAAFAYS